MKRQQEQFQNGVKAIKIQAETLGLEYNAYVRLFEQCGNISLTTSAMMKDIQLKKEREEQQKKQEELLKKQEELAKKEREEQKEIIVSEPLQTETKQEVKQEQKREIAVNIELKGKTDNVIVVMKAVKIVSEERNVEFKRI